MGPRHRGTPTKIHLAELRISTSKVKLDDFSVKIGKNDFVIRGKVFF